MNYPFVWANGCVQLDPSVSCDGFARESSIRIQTHVHEDHMAGFESSKGNQTHIVCSLGTLELLIAEFNADLPYRHRQFKILPTDGTAIELDRVRIQLYSSGHMVGSTMAVVESADGLRHCYSSDFNWPLATLPNNIDTLIVDATYGDPASVKRYSEKEVIEGLIQVVLSDEKAGSVLLTGYRGRLQYALRLLSEYVTSPVLLSESLMKTLPVYEKTLGFKSHAISVNSQEGRRLLRLNGRAIVFAEVRDIQTLNRYRPAKKVVLTAFSPGKEAIERYEPFTVVALTDHADFQGTVDFIRAISPRKVIADGSRGGNADALAQFVTHEVGIPAVAEVRDKGLGWG